jgi:hypothetical protein
MRTLLISGVAATLIGCSCYIPPPPSAALEECPLAKGFACLDRVSGGPHAESAAAIAYRNLCN